MSDKTIIVKPATDIKIIVHLLLLAPGASLLIGALIIGKLQTTDSRIDTLLGIGLLLIGAIVVRRFNTIHTTLKDNVLTQHRFIRTSTISLDQLKEISTVRVYSKNPLAIHKIIIEDVAFNRVYIPGLPQNFKQWSPLLSQFGSPKMMKFVSSKIAQKYIESAVSGKDPDVNLWHEED